jgi:2-polyprenyl-3-methyl-5-hydroxy-6-metoxy-1,4-benzoquinol methylase
MIIITQNPIALDSNDHLHPSGCINDHHDATEFCDYLIKHWPNRKTLLDLGTATGTVVSSSVERNFDAFGVEGSDAPKRMQLEKGEGPWVKYGGIRLFNADIRYPFQLYRENNERAKFDIITAWDVLEHMTEKTINTVLENIKRHSIGGAFMIATISFESYPNDLYHLLPRPREWWLSKFSEFDFIDKGLSPMLQLVRKGTPFENQFWFELG